MLRQLGVLLRRSGFPPMAFLAMGGGFAYGMSMNLIVTPFPLRVEALGGTLIAVGTAGTIFGLTSSGFRLVAGQLVDWRPGWVYWVGLLGMALATAGYLAVSSLEALYLMRFLHGVVFSAASTAYRTIVANLAPESRRGEAMALGGLPYPLASMFGPPMGQAVFEQAGMSAAFWAAAAAAVVGLLIIWPLRTLRGDKVVSRPRLAGLGSLLRRPGLMAATVAALVTGMVWGAVASFMPLLGPQLGLRQTGLFFTVFSGALFVSRVPVGRISDRLGHRLPIMVPMGLLLVGGCAILPLLSGPVMVLGCGVVMGLAFAGLRSPADALAIDDTPAALRGTGLALTFLAFDLGSSVGPLVIGPIAEGWGYAPAFGALGAIGVFCMGLIVWAGQRHLRAAR